MGQGGRGHMLSSTRGEELSRTLAEEESTMVERVV